METQALAEQTRKVEFGSQPGPQTAFTWCLADIAVIGGAAGAGKTYALLLEPLKYVSDPNFHAVIFRRTRPQITCAGGLWDDSQTIYRWWGAEPKQTSLEWRFPSGATIRFAHMQREIDRTNWDGSQIPFIGFDQLESFTDSQFFYMLSRNRSLCRVAPHIRATCNPEPDHWLRHLMAWWIDAEGYPIRERSGVIRWFVRIDSKIEWADSAAELKQRFGPDVGPKSFTFIPGQVTDNRILLANNPEYFANLQALPEVERSRLLFGCWNTHPAAGKFFNRTWFEIVRAAPTLVTEVRYWDRAATEVPDGVESDASYTAGVRMGRSQRGQFFITDVSKFRRGPLGVETGVLNCASQDGYQVRIGLEEDPGQAGIAEADYYMRLLAGYDVARNPVRESKGARARPYSAQCEAGNVKLVDGDWIEDFLREHHNFVPEGRKCFKDQVDAASGAFCLLTRERRAGAMGKIIT